MDSSKFLGKVVGIYLVIISLAMFLNMPQFINYVSSLLQDTSVMFVSGFFTLILGVLMVVGHNRWVFDWRVIITIIGWLALIKGVSIIAFPQFVDQISTYFIQNMNVAYITAGVDLVLGLILWYFSCKNT